MRTGFRKVVRDLWRSKGRTLLVSASIAAGVMAVGMIQTTNTLMTTRMTQAHAASQPSHVFFFLNGLADDELVERIARLPEVENAQGRATRGFRWKPTRESDWSQATVLAIDEYEAQSLNLIELREGKWPDGRSISIEASHQAPFGLPPIGNTIYLEVNDRERTIALEGTVRDPLISAPPFEAYPTFYMSLSNLERLSGFAGYSQLHFSISPYTEEAAEAAARAVVEKLEQAGIGIGFQVINDPGRHWAQDVMDGVGLILRVMAIASLFLSVILVINTINAVIAQQIPQIGIMKTIGAVSRQIAPLYLSGIVVYGVLALIIAVPLGAMAGLALAGWMLRAINIPEAAPALDSNTLLIQIGAGLLVPLLAALWPVLRGVGITVHNALSTYGLGSGQYGFGFIDSVVSRVRGLPRLATLALRNTFRRTGRAVLTEAVLVTSGAIFIMVLSTRYSFTETIADIWRGLGFDAIIVFEGSELIEEVVPLIEQRPNVERAEMWTWITASGHAPGLEAPEDEQRIELRGTPRDTQMYQPKLTAGRELVEADGHALLLNQKMASDMGLSIGDQIEIDLPNGNSTSWTIVGLILDITGNQETAYVHRDLLNRDLNMMGRSYVAEVKAKDDSTEAQYALTKDLREFLDARGVDTSYARAAAEDREQAEAQFDILTTVLMTVTVLMAIVGSIGLSGTLSINVIERRREIGVMRAIGASSTDVALIFMGEGLLLGLVSWMIAVPLGLIVGRPFVKAIGDLLDFPGQYSFSMHGLWIWLGIVVTLSLLASWLPARRSTQISVSQSLAYE